MALTQNYRKQWNQWKSPQPDCRMLNQSFFLFGLLLFLPLKKTAHSIVNIFTETLVIELYWREIRRLRHMQRFQLQHIWNFKRKCISSLRWHQSHKVSIFTNYYYYWINKNDVHSMVLATIKKNRNYRNFKTITTWFVCVFHE